MDKERNILIAVSNNRGSVRLMRYVNKNFNNCNVFVVHFSYINKVSDIEDSTQELIKEKAASFGYKFINLPESNVADGIRKFVRSYNINTVVIGNSSRSLFRSSLHDKLMDEIDCEILTVKLQKSGKTRIPLPFLNKINPVTMGLLFLMLTGAVLFNIFIAYSEAIGSKVTLYHISMAFILVVVYASMSFGLFYGLFTSLMSAMLISFFFVYPQYVIKLGSYDDIINSLFFIALALIVSLLGGFTKRKTDDIKKREVNNQLMTNLSSSLAGVSDVKSIRDILIKEISNLLDADVCVVLKKRGEDALDLADARVKNLSEKEVSALLACYNNQMATGVLSDMPSNNVHFRFVPISTSRLNIGVLGMEITRVNEMTNYDLQLIESLSNLAASTLGRAMISRELDQVKTMQEKDKLRADLLSSVSHDLKTPLASIIGSLTAIEHMQNSLKDEDKEILRKTALEEAVRLNGYIANILNMTRIEAGAIKVKSETIIVDSLLGDIINRMQNISGRSIVYNREGAEEISLTTDPVLLEQVMQNLLDNAIKYGGTKGVITLTVRGLKKVTQIDIADEGSGIPDDMKEKIFDKFERIHGADKKTSGTGLGLSICRNIMGLLGGSVSVHDNKAAGTGAIFRVEL